MASSAPKTSTGFVSLGDYLNANQNAVNATGQGLLNDATQAADTAQSEANKLPQEVSNASFQDPGFEPSSLADYTQAQSDAQNANTKLQNLSTFGGVSDALQSKANSSGINYTQGESALDANLLGASRGFQNGAQVAQNKYGDLQSYLDNQANSGIIQNGPPPSGPPVPFQDRRGLGTINHSPLTVDGSTSSSTATPTAPMEPQNAGIAKNRPKPGSMIM